MVTNIKDTLSKWFSGFVDRKPGMEGIGTPEGSETANAVKVMYTARDGSSMVLHLMATMRMGRPQIAAKLAKVGDGDTSGGADAWHNAEVSRIEDELRSLRGVDN